MKLSQAGSNVKTAMKSLVFAATVLIAGCAGTASQRPPPGGYVIPAGERIVIPVSAEDNQIMLNEMRYFLDLVYVSTDALSRGDLATVAAAARRRGSEQASREPPGLYEKRMYAYWISMVETRKEIDQLADAADKSADLREILKGFSEILYQCNYCHKTFQLRVAAGRP
jgi:hypothetical protein